MSFTHSSFILKPYLEMSNFKMWFTYRCVWVFKDLSRGDRYWINAKMWWKRIREDCEMNRSMWGGQGGCFCPPDFSSLQRSAFILPSPACGRLRAQVGICSRKETCQNFLEEPLKKKKSVFGCVRSQLWHSGSPLSYAGRGFTGCSHLGTCGILVPQLGIEPPPPKDS